MTDPATLSLKGVSKSYISGNGSTIEVLRDLNLELRPGEITALVAPSGSGKSTLLHIAGLLDTPDRGRIKLAGNDLGKASDRLRTRARRESIGFVYQFHHLLPEFSILENVSIPQRAAGTSKQEADTRSRELLSLVGLEARATHRPSEISGGEAQRTAIARALANSPSVLLADEPTGNLDPETAERVFSMMMRTVRSSGLAALIATHNPGLAARMDRTVTLSDGRVVST